MGSRHGRFAVGTYTWADDTGEIKLTFAGYNSYPTNNYRKARRWNTRQAASKHLKETRERQYQGCSVVNLDLINCPS